MLITWNSNADKLWLSKDSLEAILILKKTRHGDIWHYSPRLFEKKAQCRKTRVYGDSLEKACISKLFWEKFNIDYWNFWLYYYKDVTLWRQDSLNGNVSLEPALNYMKFFKTNIVYDDCNVHSPLYDQYSQAIMSSTYVGVFWGSKLL